MLKQLTELANCWKLTVNSKQGWTRSNASAFGTTGRREFWSNPGQTIYWQPCIEFEP
ncbi:MULTISPECIES: hypothetical protein [Aerosakkonema]|uniref:hypothetical protein n=1 Tax=Aerosakkonema TaxID=1246629 RepID=UPI0035B7504E